MIVRAIVEIVGEVFFSGTVGVLIVAGLSITRHKRFTVPLLEQQLRSFVVDVD